MQVTVGATEGLYISLKALAGPGDEVRWRSAIRALFCGSHGTDQKAEEGVQIAALCSRTGTAVVMPQRKP